MFQPAPTEADLAAQRQARAKLRIGIPRVLNIWSTHQFWFGFLEALGIDPRRIEFSSDTSEEQARTYAKGRGTVDCCYPVKCISGHYGELLARSKRKIDILFSPMIHSVPSYLDGYVDASLTCPRVMAASPSPSVRVRCLRSRASAGERSMGGHCSAPAPGGNP